MLLAIGGYLALVVMGVILGLLGGGGAILTLPILVYLFNVPPVLGTSYSLFVVGLTSAIGALAYFRKGELDFRSSFTFFFPSAIGVLISRRLILPMLPEVIAQTSSFSLSRAALLMFVFAALMIVVGVSMLRSKSKNNSQAKIGGVLKRSTQALGVGLLTGFVGAGGGFLIVPALVGLFGLNMKTAVGSSLFVIALNSGVGFASDLFGSRSIEWTDLSIFSGVSAVGMSIGIILGKRFSSAQLKTAFAYFVFITGILIAVRESLELIN